VTEQPRPTFDSWGADLARAAQPTGASRPRRGRNLRGLLALGLACAAVAALVVHLTSTASTAAARTPRAIANAINLRLADLPGARPASGAGVQQGGDPGTAFKRCFGSVPAEGSGDGPSFSSPGLTIGGGIDSAALGSSVGFPTAAALRRDVAVIERPRFAQCVTQALAAVTYTANGVQVRATDAIATPLAMPVAAGGGVQPVLAMRAAMTWSVEGVALPVDVDIYLVAVGRDELSFFSYDVGQPLPPATEQRLVQLLVRRALAQPH
jgi:hypothetical protein